MNCACSKPDALSHPEPRDDPTAFDNFLQDGLVFEQVSKINGIACPLCLCPSAGDRCCRGCIQKPRYRAPFRYRSSQHPSRHQSPVNWIAMCEEESGADQKTGNGALVPIRPGTP